MVSEILEVSEDLGVAVLFFYIYSLNELILNSMCEGILLVPFELLVLLPVVKVFRVLDK